MSHPWQQFCHPASVIGLGGSGGCFTNVSRALQQILSKFVYCTNSTCDENFKLKLCTYALDTRIKFQLEILTVNVISGVVYFREITLESSRNVSETTLWGSGSRLLHSPSLVAVGLLVGFEEWSVETVTQSKPGGCWTVGGIWGMVCGDYYTVQAWWLLDCWWDLRNGLWRLLHSPSLVDVWLLVGFEEWSVETITQSKPGRCWTVGGIWGMVCGDCYTVQAWWLLDCWWDLRNGVWRLLHSPSLVAVGLLVGFEEWSVETVTQSKPGRCWNVSGIWGMVCDWLMPLLVSLAILNVQWGWLGSSVFWISCSTLWVYVVSGNSHCFFRGHWQSLEHL